MFTRINIDRVPRFTKQPAVQLFKTGTGDTKTDAGAGDTKTGATDDTAATTKTGATTGANAETCAVGEKMPWIVGGVIIFAVLLWAYLDSRFRNKAVERRLKTIEAYLRKSLELQNIMFV